jgi:putative endonuclease
MRKKLNNCWVCILKCSDNSYYVGSTTDLINRMNEHIKGTFKGYTSTRRPIELVYSESFTDINEAMKREIQIKGWTRKKKQALINNYPGQLHTLSKCKNETSYENKI